MIEAKKAVWNSLEIAKILVSTTTSVLLFVFGILVTRANDEQKRQYEKDKVTLQEQKEVAESIKRKADADEAKDRDITKEYLQLMSSKDPCASESDMSLLLRFATPRHSENIKSNFLNRCKAAPNIKSLELAATAATAESLAHELSSLMQALKTDDRHAARDELKRLFITNSQEVSTRFVTAIRTEKNNYRVGLGVLTVLADPSTSQLADDSLYAALKELGSSQNIKDPTFKGAFEAALGNQRRQS